MRFELTGNLIKTMRTSLKMPQSELAKKTGYHSQYISNMERGKVGVPAFKLKIISRALNIPESSIVECMTEDFRNHYRKAGRVKS